MATFVADQAVNMVFKSCGHWHDLANGDRYDRTAIAAGEPFDLPDGCAEQFLLLYGRPRANEANVSSGARAEGLIAGLRRLDDAINAAPDDVPDELIDRLWAQEV